MLLTWLEADSIAVAAGHIPGSGFGRIVREKEEPGRRYWQTLETTAGAGDLRSGIDLFRRGRS
jgi:hypothetical protein